MTSPNEFSAIAEFLRGALKQQPDRNDVVEDEGVLSMAERRFVHASVLFPILVHDTHASVLLTQRTSHLRHHAGQISFPGGRAEPDDASPATTALREANEEIGLETDQVEIVGYLPEYRTGTGYQITPVVALIRQPFEARPEPDEVAEIFEVPLDFLLDARNVEEHTKEINGVLRKFFALRYEDRFIWGATAGIIVMLARTLARESEAYSFAVR